MKRVFGAMILALLAAPAPALDGRAIYEDACKKCHRSGVDDAPKAGKKADWEARLKLDMETLYKSVIDGKGAMDPRAGKPELSDAELRAAMDYLVGLVK